MRAFKAFARKLKDALRKAAGLFLYRKLSRYSAGCPFLAVTYANNRMMDGAGAQLHRIYGIYAISRLLKLPYIHSPLLEIGYQGLSSLEKDSLDKGLAPAYNGVFNIPSDIGVPGGCTIREMEKPTIGELERLKEQAARDKTFILARILYPYEMTDACPEAFRAVKAISPFSSLPSRAIRIAIHVRRGELFVVSSKRMLPNDYYVSVALRIHEALGRLGILHVFELYTEVPSKSFTVTASSRAMSLPVTEDTLMDPALSKIEDFEAIPGLEKFINTDPIDTLRRMATADALIMSHSSFSYVAAILNKRGTVFYHKFWHSPMNDWLPVDDSGHFSERKFIERIKNIRTEGMERA